MFSSNTQELINRIALYTRINDSYNRNEFLKTINNINSYKIRRNFEGTKELFRDSNLRKLCNGFTFDNLEILIAGSTALAAVYIPAKFTPNDLDLCIKNCSKDKLIKIENIIRLVFPECQLLVIRSIIVITWIIYKNNEIIYQIQVNILKINSWSEIMITSHSNILCLGYDVLQKQFLYLTNRWEQILYNKVHIFSNILCADTATSLNKAVNKYNKRGFKCEPLLIKEDNDIMTNKNKYNKYHKINVSDDENIIETNLATTFSSNKVIQHLLQKYYGIQNIFYSNSVKYIFPDINTPLGINMWKLDKDPKFKLFIETPSHIEIECKNKKNCNCDNICPIELSHHNVFVTNINCSHSVSLRSHIYKPISVCPICRANFISNGIKVFEHHLA